jgi:hypothetical protein
LDGTISAAKQKQLLEAQRNSRFHYAAQRIQRIVDGWPPLTEEQKEELALILSPGRQA